MYLFEEFIQDKKEGKLLPFNDLSDKDFKTIWWDEARNDCEIAEIFSISSYQVDKKRKILGLNSAELERCTDISKDTRRRNIACEICWREGKYIPYVFSTPSNDDNLREYIEKANKEVENLYTRLCSRKSKVGDLDFNKISDKDFIVLVYQTIWDGEIEALFNIDREVIKKRRNKLKLNRNEIMREQILRKYMETQQHNVNTLMILPA